MWGRRGWAWLLLLCASWVLPAVVEADTYEPLCTGRDELERWCWVRPRPFVGHMYDLIYADTRFFAVGEPGIRYSYGGRGWYAVDAAVRDARAIAWSEYGFVVVTGSGEIWHSPDGDAHTWRRVHRALGGFVDVAGGRNGYVAIGWGGRVYYSPRGRSWRLVRIPGLRGTLRSVAFGEHRPGYPYFVIVESLSSGRTRTWRSTDGRFWRRSTHYWARGFRYPLPPLVSIASEASVGWFIGVASDDRMIVGVDGGEVWMREEDKARGFLSLEACCHKVVYLPGGGTFLLGDGTIYLVREDAAEHVHIRELVRGGPTFVGLAYNRLNYVALGSQGEVYVAGRDRHFAPLDRLRRGATVLSILRSPGAFWALDSDGALLTSPGGVHWQVQRWYDGRPRFLYLTEEQRLVATTRPTFAAPGVTVVVERSGRLSVWSRTTSSWRTVSVPTLSTLHDLARGRPGYVSVGARGSILYSADGLSWEPVATGTRADLQAVCRGDGYFVAVGKQGTILVSEDGRRWRRGALPGGSSLQEAFTAVACGPDVTLVVGRYVYASTDGERWRRVRAVPAGIEIHDAVYHEGRFVFVGSQDTILLAYWWPLVLRFDGAGRILLPEDSYCEGTIAAAEAGRSTRCWASFGRRYRELTLQIEELPEWAFVRWNEPERCGSERTCRVRLSGTRPTEVEAYFLPFSAPVIHGIASRWLRCRALPEQAWRPCTRYRPFSSIEVRITWPVSWLAEWRSGCAEVTGAICRYRLGFGPAQVEGALGRWVVVVLLVLGGVGGGGWWLVRRSLGSRPRARHGRGTDGERS